MEILSDEHVATKYLYMAEKCKSKELPFNMTLSVLKRVMSRKTCAYTGIKLSWDIGDDRTPADNYPTFDRIDPAKGYTVGNVVLCSYAINQKKSNLTKKEICQLYEAVSKIK